MKSKATIVLSLAAITSDAAFAQEGQSLTKKLSNPVAALITAPVEVNYDEHLGADENGHKVYAKVQPVIPFKLNAEWNLISRTIVPIVHQTDVVAGTSKSGIGDVLQSLFFSPAMPTAGGLIWGVGPAMLLPSGSDGQLSARKWGLGPTGVMLKQEGHWTYGALANHLRSVGGDDHRAGINATYLQPFVSYHTPTGWTYGLNSESTYDWKADQWSVPINATVSKLLKANGQAIQVGGSVRRWLQSPQGGPSDWGFRMTVTFLFPKSP